MDVCILLLAHWFGDYVFQSSDMALQKSHSLKWLGIHTGVYTIVILVFCFFIFSFKTALLYVAINGVIHGITDFFTSKAAAKHIKNPRRFYPILGFDQLLHTVTLYLTYFYWEDIQSLL